MIDLLSQSATFLRNRLHVLIMHRNNIKLNFQTASENRDTRAIYKGRSASVYEWENLHREIEGKARLESDVKDTIQIAEEAFEYSNELACELEYQKKQFFNRVGIIVEKELKEKGFLIERHKGKLNYFVENLKGILRNLKLIGNSHAHLSISKDKFDKIAENLQEERFKSPLISFDLEIVPRAEVEMLRERTIQAETRLVTCLGTPLSQNVSELDNYQSMGDLEIQLPYFKSKNSVILPNKQDFLINSLDGYLTSEIDGILTALSEYSYEKSLIYIDSTDPPSYFSQIESIDKLKELKLSISNTLHILSKTHMKTAHIRQRSYDLNLKSDIQLIINQNKNLKEKFAKIKNNLKNNHKRGKSNEINIQEIHNSTQSEIVKMQTLCRGTSQENLWKSRIQELEEELRKTKSILRKVGGGPDPACQREIESIRTTYTEKYDELLKSTSKHIDALERELAEEQYTNRIVSEKGNLSRKQEAELYSKRLSLVYLGFYEFLDMTVNELKKIRKSIEKNKTKSLFIDVKFLLEKVKIRASEIKRECLAEKEVKAPNISSETAHQYPSKTGRTSKRHPREQCLLHDFTNLIAPSETLPKTLALDEYILKYKQ